MEKIFACIKNIGVWHSFEKNETATMFFLKKPFLVKNNAVYRIIGFVGELFYYFNKNISYIITVLPQVCKCRFEQEFIT